MAPDGKVQTCHSICVRAFFLGVANTTVDFYSIHKSFDSRVWNQECIQMSHLSWKPHLKRHDLTGKFAFDEATELSEQLSFVVSVSLWTPKTFVLVGKGQLSSKDASELHLIWPSNIFGLLRGFTLGLTTFSLKNIKQHTHITDLFFYHLSLHSALPQGIRWNSRTLGWAWKYCAKQICVALRWAAPLTSTHPSTVDVMSSADTRNERAYFLFTPTHSTTSQSGQSPQKAAFLPS